MLDWTSRSRISRSRTRNASREAWQLSGGNVSNCSRSYEPTEVMCKEREGGREGGKEGENVYNGIFDVHHIHVHVHCISRTEYYHDLTLSTSTSICTLWSLPVPPAPPFAPGDPFFPIPFPPPPPPPPPLTYMPDPAADNRV